MGRISKAVIVLAVILSQGEAAFDFDPYGRVQESVSKCGDFLCNGNETTSTCVEDCGEQWDFESVNWNFVHKHCVRDFDAVLTFDDGPTQGVTDILLDILKSENVPATFFIVGERLTFTDPEIVERMVDEGHDVYCHTYDHPNLTALNEEELRLQMTALDMAMMRLLCMKPRVMRPPYLEYRGESRSVLEDIGYVVSIPTVDTKDFAFSGTDPDMVVELTRRDILNHKPKGVVILQHDIKLDYVMVTPAVIKEVRSQGYRFVNYGECMFPDEEGIDRSNMRKLQYMKTPDDLMLDYCGYLSGTQKMWWFVYFIVGCLTVVMTLLCCLRRLVIFYGTKPPPAKGG